MQTIEAIKKRRSIRSYTDKPVPKKIIEELLTLANLAPSASNLQNRSFIVVQNKKTIKKLYQAAFKQSHVLEAPVIIIFFLDKKMYKVEEFLNKNIQWGTDLWGATSKNYKANKKFLSNWKRWSTLWPIQDNDATIATFLLAAQDEGLSTCWLGLFDSEKVKKILRVPKNYEVVSLLTLGYQKKPPYQQKRKLIKKLLRWEKW